MRGVTVVFGIALGCGLAPYTLGTEGAGSGGGTSTGGVTTTGTVTTTTGGAATTAGGSVGSSGCAFLDCGLDGGSANECDVWKQDCPEGQKCAPYANDGGNSWNALKCVPVMPGAGGLGEPCTVEGSGASGVDDCAKGFICWDVVGVPEKTCVAQCAGTPEAPVCPSCTSCVVAYAVMLTPCLPACSPLLQDCPYDDHCIPTFDATGFVCVLDSSGDESGLFGPCEYANACVKGLWCGPPELAAECDPNWGGCCLAFCDLTMPSCPGVGQACVPWFDKDPGCPLLENVGSCRLPP